MTDRLRAGWTTWLQVVAMVITCAVNSAAVGIIYGKMSSKDIELEGRLSKVETKDESKDRDIQEIKISAARIEEKVEMLLLKKRAL